MESNELPSREETWEQIVSSEVTLPSKPRLTRIEALFTALATFAQGFALAVILSYPPEWLIIPVREEAAATLAGAFLGSMVTVLAALIVSSIQAKTRGRQIEISIGASMRPALAAMGMVALDLRQKVEHEAFSRDCRLALDQVVRTQSRLRMFDGFLTSISNDALCQWFLIDSTIDRARVILDRFIQSGGCDCADLQASAAKLRHLLQLPYGTLSFSTEIIANGSREALEKREEKERLISSLKKRSLERANGAHS